MQRIELRQADGTTQRYKNAEFIPAFLMIPEVLLNRTNQEMITLKRTPRALFTDPETIRRVESDNFLQVIIDVYAFLAWPYMGIRGKMEDFSGYDPFWIIAHAAPLWIGALEAYGLLPKTGDFYRNTRKLPDEHFGFVPDGEIIAMMEAIVPQVMMEYGFDKMYEVIKDHRCHEDFAARPSWEKISFYLKWYHRRTEHPTVASTEVLKLTKAKTPDLLDNLDGDLEDLVWDPIESEAFWNTLSEDDKKILWLRWHDMKQEDVAKVMGLATHSAVSKRIQNIGRRYEAFTGESIGFGKPNRKRHK